MEHSSAGRNKIFLGTPRLGAISDALGEAGNAGAAVLQWRQCAVQAVPAVSAGPVLSDFFPSVRFFSELLLNWSLG